MVGMCVGEVCSRVTDVGLLGWWLCWDGGMVGWGLCGGNWMLVVPGSDGGLGEVGAAG